MYQTKKFKKKSKLPCSKVSKSLAHMFLLDKIMKRLKWKIKWYFFEMLFNAGFNLHVSVSVKLHLTIYICNWIIRPLLFVFPFHLFIFYFHSLKNISIGTWAPPIPIFFETHDEHICILFYWSVIHIHEFTVNPSKMIT